MKKVDSTIIKLLLFIGVLLIAAFFGCSDHGNNEAPRSKINSNGTGQGSVQIQTSGGNTEHINNIETVPASA